MFSYMDSPAFYIVYLCFLGINLMLCLLYYFYREKNGRISKIQPILRMLAISSIVIWLLDSIPYLYIPIFEIPEANILLSNIFMFTIGITTVIYELANPNIVKARKIEKVK